MDKMIKALKSKFLQPTVNKYYDPTAPAVIMQEIQSMYEHAKGIAAIIEVEEYCKEMAEEKAEHITDELMGAQDYINEFRKTQDCKLLALAKEEAGHAAYFINQMMQKPLDPDQKAWVQSKLQWHNEIVAEAESLMANHCGGRR